MQPGSAGRALEHSWIVESSRAGWRLGCPSELWALSFNPHPKKHTEGRNPRLRRCWSCQELVLPREWGDSTGCHLLCPPAQPWRKASRLPPLPLTGSELGRGEKWKNVFKTPLAHELSPVWGVSSLPVPAGVARPCRAAGRKRRRRRGNVAFGSRSGSGAKCPAGAPQFSPLLQDCPTLMENPRGEGTKRGELLGEQGEREAGVGSSGIQSNLPACCALPACSEPSQAA